MFPYQKWLELSITTRHEIARRFGVIKKKSTHVADNKIVDDGYYLKELDEAITLKRLQAELHSDVPDYMILWNALVSQITGVPIEIKLPDEIKSVDIFKNEFKHIPEEIMKPDPTAPQIKVVPAQFCMTCDSKGGRHKLTCPKYEAIKANK